MSGYHNLPSLAKIAETLGGDVRGLDALVPGPGHSSADRSLAVRPDEGAPDGFVVHSFAGDDPIRCKDHVRKVLGLKPKVNGKGKANGAWGDPISEHVYRTETGEPYLRVQKFRDSEGKKQFPQSHWDGDRWIKGKPEGPKIPYRLPEWIKAAPATLIYFCEGEKSVDRLTQLGFTATCISEGAQAKWPPEVAQWFKDRHVVVLPDNDAVGAKHAQKIARGLQGVAASVRILDLAPHWPGDPMPRGHDVFDWIEKHDTAGARLAQFAKDAPSWEPGETKSAGSGTAIDGVALLAEIHDFLGRFIAYPNDYAHIAHTLWVAHAHAMEAWDSTPRIAFLSPEPGSGKTRALEVSELLVPNPVEAVNVTPAYLFRKVGAEEGPPTILYDEIDTVFGPKAKDNEEIRGLLNAGHRRGAVAGRCVAHGKTVETEEIPAYCAVALAGIGWLPDTLMTRSIVIRMRRRAPSESVEPYRRRDEIDEGHDIRDRLANWAAAKGKILYAVRPAMPVGIEDRNADVWEVLFAIADVAGGDWPARAREAAVELIKTGREEEPSLGLRLLADLRTVFTVAGITQNQGLFTTTILKELYAIDDAPWDDVGKGKPLDARGLALRLRQYGVKRRQLRRGEEISKGYVRADFEDAWSRYLPPPSRQKSATSATSATTVEHIKENVAGVSDGPGNVADAPSGVSDAVADVGPENHSQINAVSDVADVADLAGDGGPKPMKAVFNRNCRCGGAGAFGYRNPDGSMSWYCAAHRRAHTWADAHLNADELLE